MPQWYYHNSNVLPLHRPRSSIMYNRNVTQSDSKMYYLHESSCHLQFMRELSIQSTGLAGVGSTVNLFGVKASSNTQHCKIIIIKKKTTHLVFCSSYFFLNTVMIKMQLCFGTRLHVFSRLVIQQKRHFSK